MYVMRHFHELSITPDQKLDASEGWVNMSVRWFDCGSAHGIMGRSTFQPMSDDNRAMHAPHIHPNAEEIIYVLCGYGRGLSGSQWYDLRQGDVLYVPKGEPHSVENLSRVDTLELLFVYAPATSLAEAGHMSIGKRADITR